MVTTEVVLDRENIFCEIVLFKNVVSLIIVWPFYHYLEFNCA